jgi:hypothetical protein
MSSDKNPLLVHKTRYSCHIFVTDFCPATFRNLKIERSVPLEPMFWIYLIAVLLAYSFTRNVFLSVFLGFLISIALAIAGSVVGL